MSRRSSYFHDKQGYSRPRAIGFFEKDGVVHPITPRGVHVHTRRYEVVKSRHHHAPRERLKIDSVVRTKYNEWHDQYERDTMQGVKRRSLPIGALENYYKSRKAAYIAEGGQPDVFNDEFDKIDVALASDSWRDLDPLLEENHIYHEGPDIAELKRKAREERRLEKELEREYAHYAKQNPEEVNREFEQSRTAAA